MISGVGIVKLYRYGVAENASGEIYIAERAIQLGISTGITFHF